MVLENDEPVISALTISDHIKSAKCLKRMSAEEKVEVAEEPHATVGCFSSSFLFRVIVGWCPWISPSRRMLLWIGCLA